MQNPKNESSSPKNQQYWGSTGSSVVREDPRVAGRSACEGSAGDTAGWSLLSSPQRGCPSGGTGPSAENAALPLQKNTSSNKITTDLCLL